MTKKKNTDIDIKNKLNKNESRKPILNENGNKDGTEHLLIECPKYLIERTMLLAKTNYQEENDTVRLLNSSENEHQKALVAFVRRTQRITY